MVDSNDDDDASDDAAELDADERPKPRARASTRSRGEDTRTVEHDDEPEPHAHVRPSVPPRGDDEPPPRPSQPPREPASEHRRDRRESLFRETLRRAVEKSVEAGVETFTKADSAFRGAVGAVEDAKLPKEFANVFFSQVDETKNAVVRVVAREVRDFLESTDIADEFYRALTSLSFEIKTEIRFIPNDTGGVRPDVRAKVAPKRDKEPRESRKQRKRGEAEPDEE
ncbi:MAG: hypothetical protein IPL19_11705 [Sandaracinaceae bacterium]|jgi:hypothetical protein|nr:hypothetical protein [Sandaracinaceae bacterium]MBK7153891.1 hypothetical protein [Sandaracinaceae bacterium]MBK7777392.1 hypothetical protein [Sandaracinaceae bacterium]MBK8408635.1 hypothetical protein [Sandaracinaceae bacterium]MBP7680853.1 hypothetical protein [Deltaproteobacteria bacterium]